MLDFDTSRRRLIPSMRYLRIVAVCLLAMSGASPAAVASPAKPDPLFTSHDPLAVTIRAPFSTLMRARPVDEDVPAQLAYYDAEMGEVMLDIGIRTRGRYRQQRSVCPFAPLRLNFDKGATGKTLFRKIDKIKLVTHCRDGSNRYSQGVLREYLAYRVFNVMTEQSFRVRLLQVTYVDTDGKSADRVEFAFLIEPRERLAKRLDVKALEIDRTTVEALDREHTSLGSVFQYFIGNTDFSPIQGATDEPCCHNYVLFEPENGPILSVPYDLDMSGFVNAAHASPNPRFGIKNVRVRLYRGRCENNDYLDQTLQAYRDNKQSIYGLVTGLPQLDDSTRKKLSRYIDDFYDMIDDRRRVDSRMKDRCV